jgi:hypothetical protein
MLSEANETFAGEELEDLQVSHTCQSIEHNALFKAGFTQATDVWTGGL